MYVVCVSVHVLETRVEEFIEAVLENARQTRLEEGNIRFDVLQQESDPARFFLYEVYRSADGFATHQKTPHYLKWKERVAEWMAEPRVGVRHRSLFPEDETWAK